MNTAAAAPPPPVTRPTIGALLRLAMPIVISRSAQVVVGLTDAAMVGQLGVSAVAAAMAGSTNTFNLLILPMGTVFIVQSFASQMAGAGDFAAARRYGLLGLCVALIAGVACVAAIPLLGPALGLLDYDPHVRDMMQSYLKWRLLSGGFAVGLEALGSYYGGIGNTRLPMVAQVAAMVLNVFFNWVLIYGHLGAPALGVDGAAIASSIATTLAFGGLLLCFLLGVGQSTRAIKKPALREFLRMLRFGLPAGFNWFIEFAAFSFFINVVVTGLGTTALAAVMAVFQVNAISFMPAFGVASAGAIFVGQAIGAGKKDDVGRTVRLSFLVAATWQGLVGLLYLVAPAALLTPFVTAGDANAATFVEVGTRILMLSAGWQLFDAAAGVLAEALRAAGDTVFTSWVRAVVAWGVFAPGAWLSVRMFHFGDLVAVGWLVLYLALLALALFLRFRTGKWRDMELIDPIATAVPV